MTNKIKNKSEFPPNFRLKNSTNTRDLYRTENVQNNKRQKAIQFSLVRIDEILKDFSSAWGGQEVYFSIVIYTSNIIHKYINQVKKTIAKCLVRKVYITINKKTE